MRGSVASPFSQNIAVLPGGQVRFASIDRTVNDTKLSQDWMAFEGSFTDERATRDASCRSRKLDPWYGGVIIDAKRHVQLMRGYPAHPLIQCAICF